MTILLECLSVQPYNLVSAELIQHYTNTVQLIVMQSCQMYHIVQKPGFVAISIIVVTIFKVKIFLGTLDP